MEELFWIVLFFIAFWIISRLGDWLGDSPSQPSQPEIPLHFQVNLRDTRRETNGHSFVVKEVQAIGLLPVTTPTNLGMCISVLDGNRPVLCHIETFQEPESPAYWVRTEIGLVGPNQGFAEWSPVAGIIPEIFHPPYSGLRQLKMVIRLIDLSDPPPIRFGFMEIPKHSGLIWSKTVGFAHKFTEKGYLEIAEDRKTAATLSIKMAMAVAMSDGNLHEQEGFAIQKSVLRLLAPYSDEEKRTMKELCNQAMKEGYAESRQGTFNLESLASRMNGIGNQQFKYEALQFCTDVMTADGVADPSELALLHRIGDLLGLDMQQVKGVIDVGLVKPGIEIAGEANPDEVLGIDPSWNGERIKKHLLVEFRKWNGRLNTLPEGCERDNAQRMLNLIAEARKKHG